MKPWEYQSRKESDIPPEISKPSNDATTTRLDGSYGLSTHIRNLSDVEMWRSDVEMWMSTYPSYGGSSNFQIVRSFYISVPTLSDVRWNTSPISQREEPKRSYIAKTNLQRIVGIIREYGTSPIPQQINFIGRSYLYTYQETPQDSEKRKILERLAVIAQREDNWDGYDSKKPTELTLNRAEHFIKELLNNDVISARFLQLEPFICSDEDGYITIECYKGKRSLCFDIQEDETKYTKIERTSANTITQTDSLNQDNYLPLLEWFLDE